ncbi:MAG: YaaR family protein [Lachnospirales bacterium]
MDLKVSEILNNRLNELKSTKVVKDEDEGFKFALSKIGKEGLSDRLGTLIDDITKQGQKLNEHMDIRDLKKYRTLISDFINEVTTNGHEYSREDMLDRRGRHVTYNIIRKVDATLDELADELMNKEKDNIAILEKTGQIEGLLLDIMI